MLLEFPIAVAREVFVALYDGALWILFGFAVAGALHVLVEPARLVRHLGARSIGACVRAALIGAPLPLCSCGVLPAAMTLRRKGASREATLSFLITTPEVGVDSIAFTAAYFGPVMAVIRPVVAVVTGIVAGALSLRLPDDDDESLAQARSCGHGAAGASPAAAAPTVLDAAPGPESAGAKLRRAARYAFGELFDEVGFWLLLAFALTGVLGAALPADFFDRYFPSSIAAMVLMVVIAAPMYVCAVASTPLAAVFVAKGASAGAALVFLLCGPATNGATMLAVRRFFGPRVMRIYLASIVGVAMTAGLVLDLVFPDLGEAVRTAGDAGAEPLAPLKMVGIFLFSWLMLRSLRRTGIRAGVREVVDNLRVGAGWLRGFDLVPVVRSRGFQALAATWIVAFALSGFLRVRPGEHALVARLGALEGTPRAPGLLYAVPFVDRVAVVQTGLVRERPINFTTKPGSLVRDPEADAPLYVTAEENLLDVRAEVQFRAADPIRFRLRVEDPEAIVGAIVRSRLVNAVALHPIDRLYTSDRAEIEAWLLERVGADARTMELGVDVVGVRLLDVHAPAMVHDAFRDVASAHEDRLTTMHQATEYAGGVVALARGEAEKLTSAAHGWAADRLAQAHGDASRFLALAGAHRTSPALTETRLYLETAERVLAGARKVVRFTDGGPQGYELWLRADGAPSGGAPVLSATLPSGAPPPARRRITNPTSDEDYDE